jgi:hypothetical protein
MSSSSCAAEVVRNVFAANNIGVALLSQHCYAQAAATFLDVLRVFRACMVKQTDEEMTELIRAANEYYHQALQQLSKPEPFRNHTMIPYVLTVVTWSSITSDCYRDNHNPKAISVFNNKRFPNILYPFRIEDLHLSTEEFSTAEDDGTSLTYLQQALKVQTSIIMHNFALAHMCLAQSIKISRHSQSSSRVVKTAGKETHGVNNCIGHSLFSIGSDYVTKNNVIASRLLAMAASLCIEESVEECVAHYSKSADGSVVLDYFMSNIQCFLFQVSQGDTQSERQLLPQCKLLDDAVLQMEQMVQSIKQWTAMIEKSSTYSSKNVSAVTVSTMTDEVKGTKKTIISSNGIAPAA